MSKNITKYLRTIAVSEFSSKRCSREYSDADTYGFKRTDGCLKVFGE